MKRFLKPLALIAAAALLLAGGYQWAVSDGRRDPLPGDVGQPMHVSIATFERVTGTGVLRCGYYDWPPYIQKTDTLGQPRGPIVDLLNALGQTLGLRIEFVESALGRQYDDLQSARIDAHCFDAAQSPLHFQRFDLGAPLFATPLYLYTASSSALTAASVLNSDKVTFAIAEDDGALQLKKEKYPDAKQVLVPTSSGVLPLFDAVASGTADVLIADAPQSAAYNAAHPAKPLRQLSRAPVSVSARYIITSKGDPAFRAMIDDGLRQLSMRSDYVEFLRRADSSHGDVLAPNRTVVPLSAR